MSGLPEFDAVKLLEWAEQLPASKGNLSLRFWLDSPRHPAVAVNLIKERFSD